MKNLRQAGALLLLGIGVAAAISGRALLENRMKSEELKPFLPNA